MEKYIAVVKNENNKVTKFQDFADKSDADAHVVTYGGFVADKPDNYRTKYWVVDADKKTLTYDKSTADSDDAAIAAVAYKKVRRAAYPEIGDFAQRSVQGPLSTRGRDMLGYIQADPTHEDHGMHMKNDRRCEG